MGMPPPPPCMPQAHEPGYERYNPGAPPLRDRVGRPASAVRAVSRRGSTREAVLAVFVSRGPEVELYGVDLLEAFDWPPSRYRTISDALDALVEQGKLTSRYVAARDVPRDGKRRAGGLGRRYFRLAGGGAES